MENDLLALWITLKLATATTVLLLLLGTPLAWWLATTSSRLRAPIEALLSLPLILPPTVLGFYLLILMGPNGIIGSITVALGLGNLAFSFSGILIGSIFYSLPFVVQPIQNSFRSLGSSPFEAAATLRAGAIDRFFSVALPMAKPGFFTAAVLGFAHTVGEFGVVLMIGGNISGSTRVLSVAIYDHVEALDYTHAHRLAAGLLAFSFLTLLLMYSRNRPVRIYS